MSTISIHKLLNIIYISFSIILTQCSSNAKPKEKLDLAIQNEIFDGGIIFFVENSGSMFGYVNKVNEFKNTLVGLAYLPEFDKATKHFYFINGTSIAGKNSTIHIKYIGDNPEVFKDELNPKSFNVGEIKYSDLNKMFEIALDSANRDQISVLISDCIYDVGEENDPITALEIEIQKTQQAFRERLTNEDIQTLIIKSTSRFDGTYYYASKKGSVNISNMDRPYYVIFFGRSNILNRLITEENLKDKIEGHFETARFFVNSENRIPFQIVPSIDLKGEFRLDYKDKHTLTRVKSYKGEFQFAFATDFSSLPFSDDYLSSINHYECPFSNFNVIKVTRITKKIPGVEGTHLVTVFTNKNPVGTLEVVLKNEVPEWVSETDTDNENMIESNHTFGFRSLMEAISKAYEYKNQGKNPATFSIEITN